MVALSCHDLHIIDKRLDKFQYRFRRDGFGHV